MELSSLNQTMKTFCDKSIYDQVDIIMEFSNAFKGNEKIDVKKMLKTVGDISIETKPLEDGYGADECAIEELFVTLDSNTDINQVLPKVIVINQLYSTRLNSTSKGNNVSVKEMAYHIADRQGEKIESVDTNSDTDILDIVKRLGDKENYQYCRKGINSAYSFATKYLSFVFRTRKNGKSDCVPITDTCSKKTLKFMTFDYIKRNLNYYPNYYESLKRLRHELRKVKPDIDYKEIDSFLWIMGKAF